MNFIGWIRDLFGIQKDMYETKKTRLEIDEIERKERERTLITLATLEDVKRYDAALRKVMEAAFEEEKKGWLDSQDLRTGTWIEELVYAELRRQRRKRILLLSCVLAVILVSTFLIARKYFW
jgi:hypothetical protein